jgi:RNase H-fold protein (predicted Holliday junction resolvase)
MKSSDTGIPVQMKGEIDMKTTKAYAKEVLELWKNDTNYFNERLTQEEFENMLKTLRGFMAFKP